jgi:hypothetical protein
MSPKIDPFEAAAEETSPEAKTLTQRLSEIPNYGKVDLDTPLPCGLTRREIEEMKAKGIKKPESIPWTQWNGVKNLTHRHMLIAHLTAIGCDPAEIAEKAGITKARVNELLLQDPIKEQITIIRDVQFQNLDVKQRMKFLARKAIRTYEDILDKPEVKWSEKRRVAQDLLDRDQGKPMQHINVSGSLISEFYEMAKQIQKPISSETSHIDSFLDAEFRHVKQGTAVAEIASESEEIDPSKFLEENF